MGKKRGMVGDLAFVKSIRDTFRDNAFSGSHRERPQLKDVRNGWMPEDLIRTVSRITGEDEKAICRRGKNSMDRAILMELLYRFCNITQPEIGRLAGGIDYSAVSVARKRLRVKMETDEPLWKRFEDMVDQLSRVKI